MTKEEARERLLEILRPGDTVYTIIRHVSSSGMTRHISPILLSNGEDGQGVNIFHLDALAAKALEWPDMYYKDKQGIKVEGCGMDMGFHLVYELSCTLWPDGFDCIGEGCPSNDHFNREEASHHRDGGYALKQKWL